MTRHVTFLGSVADWFDESTNAIIALRDRALAFVDPRGNLTGREHPYLSGISGNPVAYIIAGQNMSLTLLQGMVDTLRFGDGIRDGGWGYGRDALRGVSILVPAVQQVRRATNIIALARNGVVRSVVGAAETTSAIGNSSRTVAAVAATQTDDVSCVAHSAYNAMNRTGWRYFASLSELVSNSGISDIYRLGRGLLAEEAVQFFRYLRLAGIEITEFAATQVRTFTRLEQLVAANKRGVFLVSIEYDAAAQGSAAALASGASRVGHMLEAFYQPSAGVRFVDTTGTYFNGVAELRAAYRNVSLHPTAAVGFILDAGVAAEGAARTAGLYIRLIPIFLAGGAATSRAVRDAGSVTPQQPRPQ